MLVLFRRKGERIYVTDEIVITVVECRSGGVRIGVEAPPDLPILRGELWEMEQARKEAAKCGSSDADTGAEGPGNTLEKSDSEPIPKPKRKSWERFTPS